MSKHLYKTEQECLLDLERLNIDPEDKTLLESILRKFKNSNTKIQSSVKEKLEESIMLNEPVFVMSSIAKEYPGTFVYVNTKSNPWFKV